PATQSLPAETVTTVTPTAEAPAPTAAVPAPVLPAPQAAPPPVPAVPGAVTYHVTGNRALLDLVTVIYTDQQGALQTEVNVALPWTKTVVLDPGVTLSSVTATSVGGQLNCSITDANGTLIAAQNANSMITNCTR
ncbi:MmpS family transport accessory protein, partial [Mycobacterium sp. SMC-4]|uniref:MmpS family transport accessory protein n=1 Tax=Mycobacterium sp. SMC-4 TaxID=2857059 RepID=UPI003D028B45